MTIIAYLVGFILGAGCAYHFAKMRNFDREMYKRAYMDGHKRGWDDHTKLIKKLCSRIADELDKEYQNEDEEKKGETI